MKFKIFKLIKNLVLFFFINILLSQVEEVGDSLFFILDSGRTINIPYYSNQSIFESNEEIEKVIIVIHGQNRNANDYYNYIQNISENINQTNQSLVFSPQFLLSQDVSYWDLDSSFAFWSGTSSWTGGDLSTSNNQDPRPFFISSFAVMDSIVKHFLTNFQNLEKIIIIGNSAGGQFVNRYASGSQLDGQGKLYHIVCAPSHYLYFDSNRSINDFQIPIVWGDSLSCNGYNNYRYGLDNLNFYMSQSPLDSLRHRYYRKKIYYLVGSLDNGGTSYCESNVQGNDRYHRATIYFNYLINYYGEDVLEKHKIAFVQNVYHDAEQLFNSDCGVFSIFSIGSCDPLSNIIYPQSNFTVYNNIGPYPLDVSFVNESIEGTHSIVANEWGFGDGEVLNSMNLIENYVYDQPGEYTVSLNSYDLIGLSNGSIQHSIVQVDTIFGDINWDSNINEIDASLILKHIVQLDTLTELQMETGDVNYNFLSSFDASLVLQYLGGVIDTLPLNHQTETASGVFHSENQNIDTDNIITIPIYAQEIENVKSFVLKISYDNEVFDYGSLYSEELNNLNFIIEERETNGIISVSGAGPVSLSESGLFLNLYFLLLDGFFEQTTVSLYDIVLNEQDTINDFTVLLYSNYNKTFDIKPNNFFVYQNYPNPFNSQTQIKFVMNKKDFVKIHIKNINGHHINTLHYNIQSNGEHNVFWNGKNFLGKDVPSGVYYYVFETKEIKKTKKMILIK